MGSKTVSTMSHNYISKISESIEDSTEYDSKFNTTKIFSEKDISFEKSEKSQKANKEINDLIQYKFEWKEGGTDVKITGSFLENWKKQETMKKNINTNFFEITLDIPKGIHQFKFIIENNWICSKDYQIIKDKNNNYNNEIDLTNYSNKTKKKRTNKGINDFNCDFLSKSDFKKVPNLPWHYKTGINLNYFSCQNIFKDDKETNEFNNTKSLLENNTFKSIMTIPHEKLSHILINNDNYDINNKSVNNDSYLRLASTQRNRHKFLTMIYFSPKN